MAVNRLGEYLRQDPQTAAFLANLQQQAAAANTGTHLGGLSSLVKNLTRGYVMGQDKGKRRALSKALTSSSSTPTKIIPGSAGQIDPGVSEAEIFAAPEEYDSIRPSSGKYLTKPVAARIDPQSGPIYGRTESLKKLLSEDPNNQYVSRALLSNQDQLAARNDALKLAQINSANKLATLQDTRVHAAGQQQATKDYDRTVAEIDALNKEKLERIKLGGKDTRTPVMKNVAAAGYEPGTKEYKEAIQAKLTQSGLSTLGKEYQSALADGSWPKAKGGFEAYVSHRTTQKAVATQQAIASEAAAIARARPLPPSESKDENEDIDALNRSANIIEDVGVTLNLFKSKVLKLSPALKIRYEAELYAGISSPAARAYNDMNTTIEKLRNDTLLLNKGMQTEGDAQRALSQLIANKTDQKALIESLEKIQRINARAAKERRSSIARRRSRYSKDPLALSYDKKIAKARKASQVLQFDAKGELVQ